MMFNSRWGAIRCHYSIGWHTVTLSLVHTTWVCYADTAHDLIGFSVFSGVCSVCEPKLDIWQGHEGSNSHSAQVHRVSMLSNTRKSTKLWMTDDASDERVKRSQIIYSVIHFTVPSSDCKLPQSCYFKPSFPTWGCRYQALCSLDS